ncbi:hypothetical protein AAMO2058_001581700 [Amorphochlora amoebiformis]
MLASGVGIVTGGGGWVRYNIRWVLDYWPRRWPMIVREVSDLKTFPDGRKGPPDILALQEVNIGGGRLGQDAILSKLLPGHKLFSVAGIRAWVQVMWPLGFLNFLARGVVNFPGSTYLFDVAAWFCGKYFDRWFGPYAMQIYYTPGLGELLGVLTGAMWVLGNSTAISKRFNPSDKKVLCLGKEKVAVRVVIQIATKSISITNVHTIPSRKNTKTRRQQALKIMNWLSDEKVDGQIVLGDFNATPQEPLYSEFTKAGFKSAYFESNGREPHITFHQKHECPSKDIDPENCLDYIFFRGPALSLEQTKVELFGTQASNLDDKLYASDHFGIVANFKVTTLQDSKE